MTLSATATPPVAIIGVSAIFPGSTDAQGFWRDIMAGRDLITDVPPTHWLIEDYYDPDPKAPDKTYCRRGAFLSDVPFDPLRFGVPPTIVPATDTSQLLGLIVAQRVLEDALGAQLGQADKERISVILGVTSGQELLASMVSRLQRPVWVKSLREAGIAEHKVEEICERIASAYVPWQESTFPGLLGNVVAGRIANRMNLGGTNCVTDAACASAFSAISMALNELYLGHSDVVISGGVDTLNDIFMYMCFSKTPALSASGDCRPFSDQADGTLLGEGLCMVALKRLQDAERDGDRIYAVLRGLGSSSDGRAKSVYAPRPEGQARALARAYEAAGYDAGTVELMEAHGTATKAGDVAEFAGLKMVFEAAERQDKQWCALGSVKSQIGHTKAASGAAGLFKAVMALQHGVLPPTIKVERPNPALELEQSPFYLNTQARPWVRSSDHPRRASVSSFGFGGSNFHIALEEYRGSGARAFRQRNVEQELVVMEADSAAELSEALRAIEVTAAGTLRWLARSSQLAWTGKKSVRLALCARDEADLSEQLKQAIERIGAQPDQPFRTPRGMRYACERREGKTAFVFPGQGSQYLMMGAELAMEYPQALSVWDQAAELDWGQTARLDQVVFPVPALDEETRRAQEQQLTQTQWAQPAIGAMTLSQLGLLKALGLSADCVAGHSYGEITALHAAGAMDAPTMLRLARRRGELMAEAARTPGAMLAVTARRDEVEPLLAASADAVVVANHNAPRQVVLSGGCEAIADLESRLAEAGLRSKRLSVATAFHSHIVAEACAPFTETLSAAELTAPAIPVYANSSAQPYPADPRAMRALLAQQIAKPVRFVEQIEAMYAAGVRTFIEVGPGSVLTSLIGRILAEREHLAVALDRKGKNGIGAWHEALGQLAVAGYAVDFLPLWAETRALDDPRQQPQPKMTLSINGSNYGKPYPPAEGAQALPPPNDEPSVPAEAEVIVSNIDKSNGSNGHVAPNGANGASYANGNGAHSQPVLPNVAAAQPVPVQPVPAQPMPAQSVSVQPMPAQSLPALTLSNQAVMVHAFQEAQRQTAEAHVAFQNAMAQAHVAFLQSSERAFTAMTALVSGSAPEMPLTGTQLSYLPQQLSPAPMASAATVVPSVPIASPAAAAPPAAIQPAAAQPNAFMQPTAAVPMAAAQPVAVQPSAVPAVATPPAPAPSPPVPSAAAAAPAAPSPSQPLDAHQLLLDVVADKTGYPADMLSMDMALEADLGIDSIKRVEILSAMLKERPDLPQVDTKAMARLNTLGEIVEYMNGQLAGGQAPAATPAQESSRPKADSAVTP